MRSLVLATLLAGLLAVTAQPAQAICAVDAEGGCSRLSHSLDLDVGGDCPEDASLCIIDLDGNLSQSPNDADYDLVVRNTAGSAITLELHAIGFFNQETGEAELQRHASRLLASVEVAAGETARIEDVDVPGNVSLIRVQAMSADGRQAEVDQELLNLRIMMMQPGDGPVDDGSGQEPAGDLDDGAAQDSGKDAPALPLALLVLGCLAAVLAVRRFG